MNRFLIACLLFASLLFSSLGLFSAAPLARETAAATKSPDQSSTWEVDPAEAKSYYDREREAIAAHTTGEIAIGLSFALALIWIFGFELALKFRGDIFPAQVRARLDRLDAARLLAMAYAWGLKSRAEEAELIEAKQVYDALAAAANATLDKARQDLKLNSVDAEFLIPEIDGLVARAKTISSELQTKEPGRASAEERGGATRFVLASINRINRGWERAAARGNKLKLVAIDQLNAMRWPTWSRLDGPLR